MNTCTTVLNDCASARDTRWRVCINWLEAREAIDSLILLWKLEAMTTSTRRQARLWVKMNRRMRGQALTHGH